MRAKAVELTESEKALVARIDFQPSHRTHDSDAERANGEAACALMKSLRQRKAVPEARIRWFTDGSYNIGGHGSSRQEIFVRNGTRVEDICRHRHFLKPLRYFVYGPDLPVSIVESFENQVAACGTVTSGDIVPLGNYAKRQTRSHGLDGGEAAEEFF